MNHEMSNDSCNTFAVFNRNVQVSRMHHEHQLMPFYFTIYLAINILATCCWFTNNFTQSSSIIVCAGETSPMDQTCDEITIHFNQDTVSHKDRARCGAGSSSALILADKY